MNARKHFVGTLLFLAVIGTAFGNTYATHSNAISVTIAGTAVPDPGTGKVYIAGNYTWNGVNVTIADQSSTSKARVEIVSDSTGDKLSLFNARISTAAAITDFPINFSSSVLHAPPSAPAWYYTEGSGKFTDSSPYNDRIKVKGWIEPSAGAWNQVGNDLLHDTAACSCMTFAPSLGFKTYEQVDPLADPRGLKGETLITLGDASDNVLITYAHVRNGTAPDVPDTIEIERACEQARHPTCETLIPRSETNWFCSQFNIFCPRCVTD